MTQKMLPVHLGVRWGVNSVIEKLPALLRVIAHHEEHTTAPSTFFGGWVVVIGARQPILSMPFGPRPHRCIYPRIISGEKLKHSPP